MMDEYVAELYEQWVNGNRISVCKEILSGTHAAVTSVHFTMKLIDSTPDGPFFGLQEASVFASILEDQGE